MDMPTFPERSGHEGHRHPRAPDPPDPHRRFVPGADDEALTDPVCGMAVTADSVHKAEHAGRPYWFGGVGCRTRFLAQPHEFLRLGPIHAEPPPAAADGTVYTCPMHPEIHRDRPGDCPTSAA